MPAFPTMALTPAESANGSLPDYLGIGEVVNNNVNQPVNALPFRAYALIWT